MLADVRRQSRTGADSPELCRRRCAAVHEACRRFTEAHARWRLLRRSTGLLGRFPATCVGRGRSRPFAATYGRARLLRAAHDRLLPLTCVCGPPRMADYGRAQPRADAQDRPRRHEALHRRTRVQGCPQPPTSEMERGCPRMNGLVRPRAQTCMRVVHVHAWRRANKRFAYTICKLPRRTKACARAH